MPSCTCSTAPRGHRAVNKTIRLKNIDSLVLAQSQFGPVNLDRKGRKLYRSVSLGAILGGRFNHKTHGWTNHNVKLTAKDADDIAQVLGGHHATRRAVANSLRYGGGAALKGWMLDRIVYDKGRGWSYVAGQDYPYETGQIRKILAG